MSSTTDQFWKRVIASKLLAERECERARVAVRKHFQLEEEASPEQTAQFLVSKALLTRFQAKLILADKLISFFVGPYVIQDRLESGLLAKQWLAVHRPSGLPVLLYKLDKELRDKPETAKEIVERASAASKVRHPNVWRTFDLVDLTGTWFVVLEWPKARPLTERLIEGDRLDARRLCAWMAESARGLTAIRGVGPGPWRLDPHAIWIDDSDNVKLAPSPIVDARLFEQSLIPGEDPYLAPELQEPRSTDSQSTAARVAEYSVPTTALVYSLGRILAYAIKTAQKSVGGNVGVNQQIADLVAWAAAKDPEQRLQSLEELVKTATEAAGSNLQLNHAPPAQLAYERWLDEHARKEVWPRQVVTGEAQSKPLEADEEKNLGALQANTDPRKLRTTEKAFTSKKQSPWVLRAAWLSGALVALWAAMLGFNALRGAPTTASQSSLRKPPQKSSGDPTSAQRQSPSKQSTSVGGSPPFARGDADVAVSGDENGASVAPKPTATPSVADDGKTLWASPTAGPPLEWKYVPPFAVMFLVVRPCDLLSSSEGIAVVQAMQSLGWDLRTDAENLGITSLESVEQLQLSVHANSAGVQVCRVFYCKEPVALNAGNGEPVQSKEMNGFTYQLSAETAFYSPDNQRNVLATGPESLLIALFEEGESGTPRRELRELLALSDRTRSVNLLLAPNFFVAEAKKVLPPAAEPIRAALLQACGDEIDGLLVSAQFSPESDYCEIVVAGATAVRTEQLQRRLTMKIGEFAPTLAAWCEARGIVQYNSLLLMVQTASGYTRTGPRGKLASANSYLPPGSLLNMATGLSQMLLEPAPAKAASRDATAGNMEGSEVNRGDGDSRKEDPMAKLITLKFRQESFEDALALLGKEIAAEITFDGSALEKEGITKNQPIRNLDAMDQKAEQVLTQILNLANPAGKLVVAKQSQTQFVITTIAAQGGASQPRSKRSKKNP